MKNVIKLVKSSHNNIFIDSFNKILSQQLTHDRSYILHITTILHRYVIEQREIPDMHWYTIDSDVTETSYRVRGLRPKSEYEFRIRVNMNGTTSEPSFPVALYRRPGIAAELFHNLLCCLWECPWARHVPALLFFWWIQGRT